MSRSFLTIGQLVRTLSTGETESLQFKPGVNLLIGPPNTGKTKWLQMLDYLLGDASSFESSFDEQLQDKYQAIGADLLIGEETIHVERRWKEPGVKTKVLVDSEEMTAREFQHLLLKKLAIPLLHFPKGNPFSGQTWPELSFRMLLRHVYRQQRFWSGLVDQQPEAEQHACLMQFLGLAERVYTIEFGQLVNQRIEVENLKARREQYGLTLNQLAGDVLAESGFSLAVTSGSIEQAEHRIETQFVDLRSKRNEVISTAGDAIVPSESKGRVRELSERRASLLVDSEEAFRLLGATQERVSEMERFRADIADELERLGRAQDAGSVLSDLKITHCPACDQSVSAQLVHAANCHLCHQLLPTDPLIDGLGATRLRYEVDRLGGELKEASELLDVLKREAGKVTKEQALREEQLKMIDNELAPSRQAVSALVQSDVSAIDVALGELSERQRQVTRLKGALELGAQLAREIAELEANILPLHEKVDRTIGAVDFGNAEELLADGMHSYLNELNRLKPNVWRHSPPDVNFSRSGFNIKVGSKRWSVALGGTDTLYFLMAYQFGLLSLSKRAECHYPGLSIIDLPGDFLGESIEDKENFIVQPFVDLLHQAAFSGAQVIITGASFQGLDDANRLKLNKVYVG